MQAQQRLKPDAVANDAVANDAVANDAVANDAVANDAVANDAVANDAVANALCAGRNKRACGCRISPLPLACSLEVVQEVLSRS